MAADSINKTPPLIAIVGPTASGKTSLAIDIAQLFGGEIICADSRTIYKGMDIGTAKPTSIERSIVPHWGLDLVEPSESFSAADFKQYALNKIDEIRARNRIPFLVGGSGLYVDAVLFDYHFGDKANEETRHYLNTLTIEQLHDYCYKDSISLPENSRNKRYLIRAIEQKGMTPSRNETPIANSIIVGITTDREVLRERIAKRSKQIFESGVVEEATFLAKKYGWESEAMTGNIYPLIHLYLQGVLTEEELEERFTTSDWRLAKRQLTWMRRNKYINWYSLGEADAYLRRLLANE